MKLLLVEDEKSLSRALVKILEHANYSVDPVCDGQEALDYLEDGSYDGVILDIMIPGKDGITVLKETRAKGNNVPVLLLTAKSEVEDRVAGLDSGANDYLTKPFAPPELLARIRAMTRVKMQADGADTSGSEILLGNLRLSRTTYELSSPGGSFRLAGKEYQMMEMLMTNPNALISTDRFFEKIWGYDSDSEINVVWVYISYLRKKLEALGADVMIKASRGAGYSLVEKKQGLRK